MIDWTLTCASTQVQPCDRLVGRGRLELGDGLGALGDGVFGQLAGEHRGRVSDGNARVHPKAGTSGLDAGHSIRSYYKDVSIGTCPFSSMIL